MAPMRRNFLPLLLLALLPAPIRTQNASASATSSSVLNGWYACSEFTFASDGASPSDAECAVYSAPLCYTGVCEDPRARTVDIFVKRIAAVTDAATAPNVWFLQGGPGAGSTASTSGLLWYFSINDDITVSTDERWSSLAITRQWSLRWSNCTAA